MRWSGLEGSDTEGGVGIDWPVKKGETGLIEVLREQRDSTGAKAWLVNRIFPIQIRFSVLIRVLQRNSTDRIYIDKYGEIYYEGLAHLWSQLTEAKSHGLLSASWRPREGGGEVQVQTREKA